MKLSFTKPISSPGRPDKFPPPLMRFLRTNAGSKSRGSNSSRSRSNSNPIFLRKKGHNNTTAIETEEPSSPKVTCMGKVRVRRAAAASAGSPTKCHRVFWWVPNALFCHHKIKPNSSSSSSCSCCCHWKCKPVRPNWGFLFRRKASKDTQSSTKTELNFKNKNKEESENENRVNVNAFVSNCSSSLQPPRDALLLTKCRSAPYYRSSSLASRFWGSPLRNEEETGEEQGNLLENRERESSLNRESILAQDPKLERKLRFFKELEESLRESIMESEKVRELNRKQEEKEEGEGEYATPLVLTRFKSELARTEKVDPD